MEGKLTRDLKIGASRCDSSGRLGMYETFCVFMDAACEHADMLGCGLNDMMERGLLWVAVRIMAEFTRRPAMGEDTIITTWPMPPSRTTSERDYILEDTSGSVICRGKTEWTVIDTEKGRIVPPSQVFPDEMSFWGGAVSLSPFSRFRYESSLFYPAGTYTASSTDCDVEGHMNNTAYIRMMCSVISTKEWRHLKADTVEAYFASQVFEGDVLSLWRLDEVQSIILRADSAEGKPVFWMKITGGGREK